MRPDAGLVLTVFLAAALGGPLALGLMAFLRRRPRIRRTPWDLKLSLASALTYTLAFNLVFIVQELALVIPKALTPGLHPVLFHNNHTWTGDNPLARLLQGTGAAVDILVGLAALAWLAATRSRSSTLRLFVIWVAYSGLFQSLPQAVAGAILPGNDVGMAMDYLGVSLTAMRLAAGVAVVAMAVAGLWLARTLLVLAPPGARPMAFILRTAVLPGIVGTLLVLPFRAPGAIDQVVIVPVAVAVLGLSWMQAGAWLWRVRAEPSGSPNLLVPLGANLLVLAIFQFALRPGVAL